MRDDFAVFILSHGRAEKVVTINTLRKSGYTGEIYIICDDEDSMLGKYQDLYGNKVIVFNKKEMEEKTDTADLSNNRKVVVFARNACHEIAKKLGLTYFLELDDDYVELRIRYWNGAVLAGSSIKDLDSVIDRYIDFLEKSGARCVCWAQCGDLIGGVSSFVWQKGLTRKAMNAFFCKTDRPFQFYGRINEDTTAYTYDGQKGQLFFTVRDVVLNQMPTQQNSGGLTDVYLDLGTYVKSFYSVMFSPSCVKVRRMTGTKYQRIHHYVDWERCSPQILSEKWKKQTS